MSRKRKSIYSEQLSDNSDEGDSVGSLKDFIINDSDYTSEEEEEENCFDGVADTSSAFAEHSDDLTDTDNTTNVTSKNILLSTTNENVGTLRRSSRQTKAPKRYIDPDFHKIFLEDVTTDEMAIIYGQKNTEQDEFYSMNSDGDDDDEEYVVQKKEENDDEEYVAEEEDEYEEDDEYIAEEEEEEEEDDDEYIAEEEEEGENDSGDDEYIAEEKEKEEEEEKEEKGREKDSEDKYCTQKKQLKYTNTNTNASPTFVKLIKSIETVKTSSSILLHTLNTTGKPTTVDNTIAAAKTAAAVKPTKKRIKLT